MKLYGLFGKGSGKLGSSVFAISSGEQIVREYNPVVENPNTPAQVEQRAKFKLLSQLAASLASIIVIPKQGLVSSRNRFIGYNMSAVTYADNTASVELAKLTITGGAHPVPTVSASAGTENQIVVEMRGNVVSSLSAAVLVAVKRDGENGLIVLGSTIVERQEGSTIINGTINAPYENAVVFAYGIVGDIAAALASYDNVEAPTAEVIAKLVADRSTTTTNLVFTKTGFAVVGNN